MEKEEVELLPSGLVTCFLDSKEVKIIKISPKKLTVRTVEKIDKLNLITLAFYIFDEFRYEEVVIEEYDIIEEKQEKFYFTYAFSIGEKDYCDKVKKIIKNYTRYVMLKNFSDGNEFSEEMVGYPAEKDYEFYDYYSSQKREWMFEIECENNRKNIMDKVELAINLDNDTLYEKYLQMDIISFKDMYLEENYLQDYDIFKKDINRLYIGNEFCHNLFPKIDILMDMLNKAEKENLNITLSFTYMRDCYIEKTGEIINQLYDWCLKNNKHIEIIINDWGMLKFLQAKESYLKPSLGVLLNKRKKDPRYIYKKGYKENKDLMGENSLNSSIFQEFLKEYGIERYEYENCGYKMDIAEGNHSLHMPFYVTNISQYCPLYAKCTTMDRGSQKLVKSCPKYCKDYVFLYPKHLKMIGKYNSLFAFDDTLLKDLGKLEEYIKSGIDRIVLNFI